jgi:hypothetical protein
MPPPLLPPLRVVASPPPLLPLPPPDDPPELEPLEDELPPLRGMAVCAADNAGTAIAAATATTTSERE